MDIKKIFATSKKRRGRSRYLLSVTVKVGQDKNGENGIEARIVCVRNRNGSGGISYCRCPGRNFLCEVYVQTTRVHAASIAGGLRILSLEIYGFQGAVSIFYVGSLSHNKGPLAKTHFLKAKYVITRGLIGSSKKRPLGGKLYFP